MIISNQSIDKKGYTSLAIGCLFALISFYIPIISHIFTYFSILVHELGHALFGTLFAYPSIPAFDFVYGGGVTTMQSRDFFFLGLVYCALAFVLFFSLHSRKQTTLVAIVIALYSYVAFNNIHQQLILFMGHGMELLIAGIFLYRAMSGRSIINRAEQPLYATIGFFIVFFDMRFAYRLMTSSYHRTLYENAKGGGHWMDFSQLSQQLGISLPNIAFAFLLCCFLPIVLSFVFHRYRNHFWKMLS